MGDKPQRRYGHIAVCVDHYILVIGGKWTYDQTLSHHVIWMYNLYTEQWTKQITHSENVPSPRFGASGTVIGADIYMFGGFISPVHEKPFQRYEETNAFWKLSRMPNGCFVWNELIHKSKAKSPSPRGWQSGWEYAGKLWIFGGSGDSLTGFLNENGNFAGNANNQLLCFDPSCKEWTNPTCAGEIPEPRRRYGTAQIKNITWVFGGQESSRISDYSDSFYQLDMDSLTWTRVQTGQLMIWPAGRSSCTLTAIAENQLLLHGGSYKSGSDTWIFDVTTMTWRAYGKVAEDKKRERWLLHSCTAGINSGCAVIIGGRMMHINDRFQEPQPDKHILLESKSLQHLAMQTVYKNREELPVQLLPAKLTSLLGL